MRFMTLKKLKTTTGRYVYDCLYRKLKYERVKRENGNSERL